MASQSHSANLLQGQLNTLAQTGTRYEKEQVIIVQGNGSDLKNTKALKGRGKRKLITQSMVISLIEVVDISGPKGEKQGYWNTYHCQNKINSANGKLYGKYCKNRFCTLCCSIRKADIINRYLPIMKTWASPYLVTLTIRAVKATELRKFMKAMIRGFGILRERYKKRNQRGKGKRLIGIKSLECNFNPEKKTYNPHFHLIVPDKLTAEILIKEWLNLWTLKFAGPLGQNMKCVFNNQTALIEIVKYGSKIFTEPDVNKKSKAKDGAKIHAAALHTIFTAMKGLRIFERFGFNLPAITSRKVPKLTVVKEYDEWVFEPARFDWLNTKDGMQLANYSPPLELLNLLKNSIDIAMK